ncbi:phosphatase PAP2 family protein [Rossellomorea vietnamensis]|uniref:phosphatase PAP2 family protein n=1 Tax=Rossellomorea vietnamensis TaxID=218284 RepID=UPI00207909F5|nr:phosphatase PAP2 family protein [Rossellomorea vietnamensis]
MKKRQIHWKQALFFSGGIGFIILLASGFITIVDEWQEQEIEAFDSAVYSGVSTLRAPWVTEFMKGITFFGGIEWISILTALAFILFLVFKKYSLGFYVLFTIALGGGFNWLLKAYFKRERPDIEALVEQGGYSFPSGHSMGSFVLYGTLAFAVFRLYDHTWSKILGAAALMLLVLLIGLSRIYLGVHYPSDILGGFSAGGVWLLFSILVYTFIKGGRPWKKISSL